MMLSTKHTKYNSVVVKEIQKDSEFSIINHIIVEAIPEDKTDVVVKKISIQNTINNVIQELSELIENKRERCYFCYGMADIDVYKSRSHSDYYIMNSPNEGLYEYFQLSLTELNKLVNYFKQMVK